MLKNKLPSKIKLLDSSLANQKLEHENQISVKELMAKGKVTSVLLDGWIMKQGDNWLGDKTWKSRFAKLTVSISFNCPRHLCDELCTL